MKKLIVFSVFLLVTNCFAQKNKYFEGVITYKSEFECPDKMIDVKMLEKALGTSTVFYFKEGNYYQTSDDAEEVSMNIRSVKDARYYIGDKKSDTVHFVDFSEENEMIIESNSDDTSQYQIEGYECSKYEIKVKSLKSNKQSTRQFYYSDKLAVNPEWYIGTNYNHEYLKFQKTSALPVRIVMDYGSVKVTLTAIKIERKKIDSKLFKLPANIVLIGD